MINIRKTSYSIEYNPASKTWCLYKNIEGGNSYNFYPIVQSESKKDCQIKLKEINEKIEQKKLKIKQKKVWATIYNLYKNEILIDSDTRNNLIKKHKVPQNVFNQYFYKTGTREYRTEKTDKKC